MDWIVSILVNLFNFFRDIGRGRKEAQIGRSQHLVKAVRKTDRSNPGFHIHELYLVNSDDSHVSSVIATFLDFSGNAVPYPQVSSIAARAEHLMDRGRKRGNYKSVDIAYTDARGNPHGPYRDNVYWY